jgi:regulator of protease activity HflC (stomatin/prohibitin superfamily)
LVDSLGIENETRIDLRIVTNPVEQQETITKDSVTVKVNAVLWFRVNDPEKAVLMVESFRAAVQQVALTSLRNVIGQHELDEVLKERDKINALLKRNVLENTAAWGLTVELLEMKDVEIPQDLQRVMAMEAEAMREKRARIIKADAELEASQRLADAANLMVGNPAALELRRMQMVAEVGAENREQQHYGDHVPSRLCAFCREFIEVSRRKGQRLTCPWQRPANPIWLAGYSETIPPYGHLAE